VPVTLVAAAMELLAASAPTTSFWSSLELNRLVLPDWTLYLAAGFNALSGAAFAARRGFDFTGVVGMAFVQGIGGLILLSVLLQLGVPFVLTDPWYIAVAATAGLLGFFFAGVISQALRSALVLDALAMGLFVSVGVGTSVQVAVDPIAAIFMGVVTATGGLILRDILAGTAPTILRPGVLVGVVALAGSALFVVLVRYFDVSLALAQVITVAFVALLRILAVVLDWRTHEATDVSDRMARFWEGRR
jgi:uncharacterized membrane protein YeiH